MLVAIVQAITETRCKGKALERSNVCINSTIDVPTAIGSVGSIALSQRATFHV